MKTTKKSRSISRKTRSRGTPPKARPARNAIAKLAEKASYALNKLAKKF